MHFREGLSTRAVGNSEEIQLRIDPVHGDLDEEIDDLHGKIKQLKTVRNSPFNLFILQLFLFLFYCRVEFVLHAIQFGEEDLWRKSKIPYNYSLFFL